jgi:hypothetical protein
MPRMYNKRVGVNAIDKRMRKRVSERDAIVWSVDEANDIVNLRIQGSDKNLVAHYHQVLNAVPRYVKPGAAVRVRHRRGNKGYVEVTGTGRAVPTPVGIGSSFPVVGLTDVVLSGMEVLATDPLSMTVRVNPGTYRLDNTLHVWSKTNNFYYVMNDPAPLLMGTDPVYMGAQYYVVTIPAAPSTPQYGRYDILVVGPHDDEIDVVSGSEVNLSTTEPTMPSTPANHVLVEWIFVMYGDTTVDSSMIGKSYQSPGPETITISLSGTWVDVDDQLTWNPSTPPQPFADIQISVTDQYGGSYSFGGARGRLTLSGGFGQVYGSYSGWRSDYAESSHSASVSFKYERDQTASEFAPILLYEVTGFSTVFVIVLLDSLGDPI